MYKKELYLQIKKPICQHGIYVVQQLNQTDAENTMFR